MVTPTPSERSQRLWQTSLACCLIGGGCLILPAPIQSALKSTVNDLLMPGQTLAQMATTRGPVVSESVEDGDEALTQLQSRVRELELRLRQESLRRATLADEVDRIKRIGTSPFLPQVTEPLVGYDLLAAKVLGHENDLRDHPALLLDLGTSGGVTTDAFVVRSANPVVDAGRDLDLSPGQPVYAGRCVVGRIHRTGRWTSVVQLISDPQYSGRAQILRRSGDEVREGAEGLISGTGDGRCLLSGVPYTEPVAVGDEVYTGGRSARFPAPMFYGTIVSAELIAGQRWEIVVEPAVEAGVLREVAVLRESLNTTRVLGQ